MQEIIRRDLPYLPIFQYTMVEGIKRASQGFAPNVNVQENSWNAGLVLGELTYRPLGPARAAVRAGAAERSVGAC